CVNGGTAWYGLDYW
nr:immunoglobulin heavy chain junction region [Macaca mulatta]MOV50569.1 immunoglobulin heavy chain junction region [Macaca mulatta]MOV50592.1 immunoglobulin heavy chain junction region [Macaca mulatta]MOV50766.1 immunoglobulin heavy chain junction region [Macaca mulatta]MOV51383.1 immunoglobulin heavy chain junction region [Macaca mulatta]